MKLAGKIIIVLIVLLLSTLVWADRIALVIGNGDYSGAPLRNPVNDAHDMAAILRSLDFEVIEKTNLDKRSLENAAESFEDRVRSDDVALFYYSGHGLQVDGANYLIPLNANIDEENDVRYEAVELNRIIEKLAKAKLNIIILDACRDNPFKGVRSASKGLAQIITNQVGTFIAYSTAPGATAADGSGRNSPYTKYLLEQMQTDLKIEDTFKEVRKSVIRETGNRQIPWDASCLADDFYFCMSCAPKATLNESNFEMGKNPKTDNVGEYNILDSFPIYLLGEWYSPDGTWNYSIRKNENNQISIRTGNKFYDVDYVFIGTEPVSYRIITTLNSSSEVFTFLFKNISNSSMEVLKIKGNIMSSEKAYSKHYKKAN